MVCFVMQRGKNADQKKPRSFRVLREYPSPLADLFHRKTCVLVASNFTFRAARLRLRLLRSVAAPLPKKMLRLFSGAHRVRRL